ncbi:hypothetical protein [Pseudophaeobacter sp.]|uniref:hypothetical protein n=1 Tax=Pseudophaeobacter sp. TaxID=1971739 RepID=UPI003298D1AF
MEKTNLDASVEESGTQPEIKATEKLSSNNIKALCSAVAGLAFLALGIAGWIYEKPTYPALQVLLGILNLFMAYRLAFSISKEGRA